MRKYQINQNYFYYVNGVKSIYLRSNRYNRYKKTNRYNKYKIYNKIKKINKFN